MNTGTTADPITDRVLAAIPKTGIWEENLIEALFPRPAFPKVESEAALEQWRNANAKYSAACYGSEGVPYQETYAFQVSSAALQLQKEGKIRIRNGGYNTYCFTRI